MGFSDDDIRTVREKVNIVDVIGEKVALKKSGRTFKGRCPFHTEKTPSFHVDPTKQLYHCFGCGVGGDVISFLMAADGYDFSEALETLARRTGHTLRRTESRQMGRKTRLLKICEDAAAFYEGALRSPQGTAAREYAKRRNLAGLAAEYRLGYSPDWSSILKDLRGQGHGEADIMEAGIVARSAKGTLYDRLKGRLIFPILDNQGRPIAFGGRVLDDSTPKYLNSPETPLYHKGATLYGLSQAKTAFLRTDTAIVVEGYTDLLALAGAGLKNVTATLGTAFTEAHLNTLARFVGRVILVFDGDEAGLKAAERSSDYINMQRLPGHEALKGLVENVDTELVVAVLPASLDPADYMAKHGVAEFARLTADAQPLGLFMIDRIIARYGSDRSGKIKAAAAAGQLLAGLSSPVAKEEYMRYLSERLGVSYEAQTAEIKQAGQPAERQTGPARTDRRTTGPERELLRLLLKWPEKAVALNDVDVDTWPDPLFRRLGAVLKGFGEGKGSGINSIIHSGDVELSSLVSELATEPFSTETEDHFMEIYTRCKEAALDRRIDSLKRELERTESSDKKYDQLFEELVALEYKRRGLKSNVTDGGSLWVRN